jgi:16S rRNA C967 or C1407 C5-methylase (RsmB/RsmF family)/NOL1/NOP2/fmu family ribosome biogenesis protein
VKIYGTFTFIIFLFLTMLPAAFIDQMKTLLGDEYPDFEISLTQTPPISIRYNPQKHKKGAKLESQNVKWCESGQYLPERPVFTLDPAFHSGAYYVQEASSMLIDAAVRQVIDCSEPIRVLDLCAAPGGKTTLLTSALHPDSLVLCNEVIRSRVSVLKENIYKWGYPNVHVSNHDTETLDSLKGFFDLILVDAPCSGEGLFRKDIKARDEWSLDAVALCAGRQKRILAAAAPLLAEGGILMYSTCTYNQSENQDNASWLIESFDFEHIKLNIDNDWGVIERPYGYQCYPHKVQGEGFFLSVFKKNEPTVFKLKFHDFRSFKALPKKYIAEASRWIENADDFSFYIKPNQDVVAVLDAQSEDLKVLDRALFAKGLGLTVGNLKGNDIVPSHEMALSIVLSTNLLSIELSRNEALHYLKGENFEIDAPKGWLVVRYEGLALGWLKNLGNRFNNYLPNELRIRMGLTESMMLL